MINNLSDILDPNTQLHQAELGDPKEITDRDIEAMQDFKNFIEYGNKTGWDKIYNECGLDKGE